MKKIIFSIGILSLIMIFGGCRTPKEPSVKDPREPTDTVTKPNPCPGKPNPGTGTGFSGIIMPNVENSKYSLRHTYIVIEGTAESRDREAARNRATSAAYDSLFAVVRNTVGFIAKERGLEQGNINKFTVSNTEYVDEKTVGVKKGNGTMFYRNTQSLKFDVESILKDLYPRLNPSKEYSINAFYRDFDYLTDQRDK